MRPAGEQLARRPNLFYPKKLSKCRGLVNESGRLPISRLAPKENYILFGTEIPKQLIDCAIIRATTSLKINLKLRFDSFSS